MQQLVDLEMQYNALYDCKITRNTEMKIIKEEQNQKQKSVNDFK
jgi:hypothetical protein